MAVKVQAFNDQGTRFYWEGHGAWVREQLYGAYGIGIGYGPGPEPNKWDGHLVLIVKNRYLLDLSIEQASRPNHNLILHPFFAELRHFGPERTKLFLQIPTGGMIAYESNPSNDSWRDAPDWKKKERWTQAINEIVRVIR